MDWYIPITILPAVGLMIMSTVTQMVALSAEIGNLLSGDSCSPFEHKIAGMKIKQLTRLTRSTAFLYISAACFVFAGILGAVLPEAMGSNQHIPQLVLLIGVFLLLCALGLLIIYGIRTITIRKVQHEFIPHEEKD